MTKTVTESETPDGVIANANEHGTTTGTATGKDTETVANAKETESARAATAPNPPVTATLRPGIAHGASSVAATTSGSETGQPKNTLPNNPSPKKTRTRSNARRGTANASLKSNSAAKPSTSTTARAGNGIVGL